VSVVNEFFAYMDTRKVRNEVRYLSRLATHLRAAGFADLAEMIHRSAANLGDALRAGGPADSTKDESWP
jgi:hypothetical protein